MEPGRGCLLRLVGPPVFLCWLISSRGGCLRLEHLESLLEKKRVNPAWIINGEGRKYITKEIEPIATSTNAPQGRPTNKKELMDAIMRYCQVRALPGDLSYAMLDKLVEKALPVESEITTNPAHTVESLSLVWISMLEFAQQILVQGVEFEYDGKKYGLRPR